MFNKILPRVLILSVLAALGLVSISVVTNAPSVSAAAARCFVQAPYLGGGLGECPDNVPGYTGGFQDDKCYDVTFSTETQVTEQPCDSIHFAESYSSAICADGTGQSGPNKTPAELCADHGGLPDQNITCIDRTSKTLPHDADDAAKIAACADNCGYNTEGGVSTAPECAQYTGSGGGTGACQTGAAYSRDAEFTCIDRKEDIFDGNDCGDIQNNSDNCNIIKMANKIIEVLSAVVGVVITIAIIVAGIRYASAGGDPNATATAKNMIKNAVIALIAYMILFGLLNWIVPGGLL